MFGLLYNVTSVASVRQLYNVVVDTEVVGKKLLERGQLQKRVTFIPLNKISSSSIDQRTIQHAERVVSDLLAW